MLPDNVNPPSQSPRWGYSIKLVVSLTLAAILFVLVIRFRTIIGPLLLTVIMAYLIYPLAEFLCRKLKFKWQAAVAVIYLLLLVILISLITWGGVALAPQLVSLFELVQDFITNLPETLANLSSTGIRLGSFVIDLSAYRLSDLANQALGLIRPVLGEVGGIVGTLAGGAAGFLGWLFFVLLVSFFILLESGGAPGKYFDMHIPGFTSDAERIVSELGRIWNAFLRGQFFVVLVAIAVYSVVLSVLGVRYAIGLALLAGIARFIPYVGAWATWITIALVSYFQAFHPFGLSAFLYAVIVVVIALVIDMLMDNFIATRILSRALRIHPAAVLIAAIVMANLIGLVGVMLASPMVATIKLFLRYVKRKLFDQDPWEGLDEEEAAPVQESRLVVWMKHIWRQIPVIFRRLTKSRRK